MIRMHWTGDGITKIAAATRKLEGRTAYTALRRAVNHTGDRTFTAVKRAVANQAGVSQSIAVDKGGIRKRRANASALEYLIISKGGYLPLRYFKPTQLSKGTKASPWGSRKLFEHAFMGPRPGLLASRLKGNVFVRSSDRRLPIRKLWGPAIPREIVRDETARQFEAVASTSLPSRVEHEITRMTRGVVSR